MPEQEEIPLSFKSEAETEAFAKWYLRATVSDIQNEFSSDEQRNEFLARRERRLKVQLDDLSNLHFESAITCPISDSKYYKIAKLVHKKPLSSVGSDRKSSRFNYKNVELFKNRVIYFGQDRGCCYAELFHLDIQKQNYLDIIGRSGEEAASELPAAEYLVYEYQLSGLDNILVLTTEPSYKALGIPVSVTKNEWYPVNDEYEIPTSGQILASIARRRGYKGILYTSVRTQTKNNLVLFEENTGPLSFSPMSSQPLDHGSDPGSR